MNRAPLVLVLLLNMTGAGRGAEPTPSEVFEKRIVPIFRSPEPSSCVQCHLASVDLKNYIRPTAEATFVSLRDQGLIDLDQPERSKILDLIRRGADDTKKDNLVHQKVRKQELEAFTQWLILCAKDERLRKLPRGKPEERAAPAKPVEVIRHARQDRVLESFTNTVWALRFRCMNCHTEGSADNAKLVKEHGERVTWFLRDGPEATLTSLRKRGLIDIDEPEKSLLLRKPLNEVKHGGGKKFEKGDQGYKAFRSFIEDYVRLMKGQYADARSLPVQDGPLRFGSERWLKITGTPAAWADKLLQVDVYAWDADRQDWEPTPVATSDRGVYGKGQLWQHTLTLLAERNSARARAWTRGEPALPRGKYLLRIYVDANDRLARDWKATLGEKDFVGAIEVQSDWPAGYARMTTADGRKVKK